MISHCPPRERAAIERTAVAAYFQELTSLNPKVASVSVSVSTVGGGGGEDTSRKQQPDQPSCAWTFEQCWAEYVAGGLGRWLFFLPYDGWGAHHSVSQYFCDQVLAFIRDHGITPDSVPMPRL